VVDRLPVADDEVSGQQLGGELRRRLPDQLVELA
jgi:hypothetical protein